MLIERINPLTKFHFNIEFKNVTKKDYDAWLNGGLIQKVFTNLSTDEREYILSGVPMGLFDLQFETHFLDIVSYNESRIEIYFSESLKQFFVFQLRDNTLIKFFKLDWKLIDNLIALEVNKIDNNLLELIQKQINQNKLLLNFLPKFISENELIFSKNNVISILNQFCYENEIEIESTKNWLSKYISNNH